MPFLPVFMMDPGKFQFSSDSPAMQQAQNIWSMLDDMADSDPSAYRKFIERHLKEGKEMMQPPQPHMCIVTQTKVCEPVKLAAFDLLFVASQSQKLCFP